MFDRMITFHARLRPQALAITSLAGHVTYAEFDDNIDRFAAALAELDPPRPGLAAVVIADRYLHWVITLALARLGVTATSYLSAQRADIEPLLRPDLVITDEAEAAGDAERPRIFRTSKEWLGEVARRPAIRAARPKVDRGGLARIANSSGTTGAPKKFGVSWAKLERMIESRTALGLFGGLSARPLFVSGPEHLPLNVGLSAWFAGGTEIFAPNNAAGLARALPLLRPERLGTVPIQLKTLLDAMLEGALPQPELTLIISGAHAPRALCEEARRRLTNRLVIMYGTNEAGPIATRLDRPGCEDADAGLVDPHVEVEVVDAQDRPLPFGAVGAIRVRGDGVIDGYLDDAEANARHFRDGWFYPGDVGSVTEDGRMRVEGRESEVMNFGGVKFMPQTIETAVLGCPGVADAGAFTLPDEAGIDRPWVAIVKGGEVSEAALAKALTIPGLPMVNYVWTDRIPRLPMGKIQRDQLQAATLARKTAPG